MIARRASLLLAALCSLTLPAFAQMSGMDMRMKPAHFAATREAFTTNHRFLVKLIAVPNPIPYQKYFQVRFAVYDGRNTTRRLPNARVDVYAGMRHGMTNDFAHGMQSTPKVREANGVATVSGMYFHMLGRWTLVTRIHDGGKAGVAFFDLPCCAQ